MFSVIRTLRAGRAGRSLSNYSNLSKQFSFLRKTYQFCGPMGIPNLHSHFRQKRFSSRSDDPHLDPLSDCDAIYPLNKVQIEELAGNDPREIQKLKILQMGLAVKRVRNPDTMPERIRLEQWRSLLSLPRTARIKYLEAVKKKEDRYVRKVVPVTNDDAANFDPSDYDHSFFEHRLFRNCMFPMIHPNTISAAMNSRVASAIDFSPTIIIDCGYELTMTVSEIKNVCQQLGRCIYINRNSRKPYSIVICNLEKDTLMSETLWAAVPNIYNDDMPIITSEKCYTNLYPKEKLVYLTPHCRETVDFNPTDIYIIGALVDKSNPRPHSLIKAKTQGIRMGSFPLDKYLVWKKGKKSLTIDQVFMIMSKMLQFGDWAQSFSSIPKRKISDIVAFRGIDKRHKKFEF